MTISEFNVLITRQASTLKMHALRFTQDAEDANDLVQDTLLKAITYYDKFRDDTNLKGWLYTIMKNTFINNYRQFIKISSVVTKSDEISSANLVLSSTKNNSESKFIMDDIKKAINNLPAEYYIPFTMKFEGHKYHEIAEYLSIPVGTVKTRIHIAKKLLKQKLEPYGDNYKACFFGT